MEARKQPRTPDRFIVQIHAVHDSRLAEVAKVENVSSSGARLTTERYWEPGCHVIFKSSTGNVWARARVVYCQAINGKAFAVGLNFLIQTSDWETRTQPSTAEQPK